MKTRTIILMIASIAVVFSIGIAIVDRAWTMDSFWPLIGGAVVSLGIGIGNWIQKK